MKNELLKNLKSGDPNQNQYKKNRININQDAKPFESIDPITGAPIGVATAKQDIENRQEFARRTRERLEK
ncbi:MAG: hypothetical protein Fur009_4300 [Candidatus Microgenomates bacterium]